MSTHVLPPQFNWLPPFQLNANQSRSKAHSVHMMHVNLANVTFAVAPSTERSFKFSRSSQAHLKLRKSRVLFSFFYERRTGMYGHTLGWSFGLPHQIDEIIGGMWECRFSWSSDAAYLWWPSPVLWYRSDTHTWLADSFPSLIISKRYFFRTKETESKVFTLLHK